jgi:predicted Zn-dependent protease
MNTARPPSETAFRVSEELRSTEGLWDVFGESIRRFELHLNGTEVEMSRGPIVLEGYGYREIRPSNGGVRVGFAGSTDLSHRGIARTIEQAHTAGEFSKFPAKEVALPARTEAAAGVESWDPELWERPEESIARYAEELLAPFDGRKDARPSFGSLRLALIEATFANSAGAEGRARKTNVEFEFAVRSASGPEGPKAGEYWVNRRSCRLDHRTIGAEVGEWCRRAQDARAASPMPAGTDRVVLPTAVLSEILPATLGFRLSGPAALRGMMPALGSSVAASSVDLYDDGLFPFALSTSPWDDEGSPQVRRHLVEAGAFRQPIYDLLYASALGAQTSASGRRDATTLAPWFHFMIAPHPSPSTMVLSPGPGGSDAEMIEAVGDGLWVDQLGYAFPDAVSSAFGGEVRLGYLIRGGKLTTPVRGGTVGGVVLAGPDQPSMMRSIRAIGSAPSLVGQLSAPTISVGSLSVAGA